MPRKGSPYGGDYERLRARLLAGGRRCAYCSAPATEADHVPPIALHRHTGRGCCHLVPSCGPCARRQGALIAARRWSVESEAPELVPEPIGFDVLDPVWDRPWLDKLREVPANAVWPRLMTVPHRSAVGTFGGEFEAWCRRSFGVRLRWWQRLVVYRLLEHDAKGRLVWRSLLLTLARQLGKSKLLAAFLLWRMTHGAERFGEEQLMLHLGKDTAICREVQREARQWAKLRPDEFKVTEANGKEAIEHLSSAGRWLVRAEDAVIGFSGTTALADECWDIKATTIDEEVEPALVEHVESQLLLVSTAHRKATSLMLGRRALAVQALDAAEDGDLFIEWSAPRDVDVEDRTAWRLASPHWGAQRERMIASKVAKALAGESVDSSEPDPIEAVRSQWLNIWPAVGSKGGRGEPLVDLEAWAGLKDVEAVAVGPLAVAVDDYFGQGASATAAGVTEDDRVEVGGWCFDTRAEAYAWAEHWLAERAGSVLLHGLALRGDAELDDMPAEVESRGATETRAALSLLRELVAEGTVVHDGAQQLREHVAGARVTPAPSGGLQLVPAGRVDLVRCAAWAVAEAHRSAGLAPAVHGGAPEQAEQDEREEADA